MRTSALLLRISALLVAGVMSAAQAQQGVSLATGLTDFTTWSKFGGATAYNLTPGNGFTYSNLVLTTSSGAGDQAGAGFAPGALTMDFNQAFSFDFHFWIGGSGGEFDWRGDGLTFTLTDARSVGGGGSGLGYLGMSSHSVAFAIDTFDCCSPGDEPLSPSLQILKGGNVTPLAYTETGLGDSIRDRYYQWYATVNYAPSGLNDNAGTLTGYMENLNPDNVTYTSFSVSAGVNFDTLGMVGKDVYYGFTAANGGATDGHYVTSAMPVPEPGAWAMTLAGLAVVGFAARRRARRA